MSMTAVAKLARVSQATVSRVYNNPDKVSEKTRLRVEEAMRKVGYSLARRQPKKLPSAVSVRSIAVLALDDSLHQHGSFSMTMFLGIQDAAAKLGISTFIGNATDESNLPGWIKKIGAEGVLLIGNNSRPGFGESFGNLPSVWLTSHAETGADAVLPGNDAVGRLAVDYLCNLKCRNLAFVSAIPENPSYRVRGDAFEREASARGLNVRQFVSRLTVSGSIPQKISELEPRIDKLVNELLEHSILPDGIFVPSDFMTALFYRSLNKEGVTPGDQIKIVSCDNKEPYLAGLLPRPATIDIAGESRGRRALHELLWRIENPDDLAVTQLILEPSLIVY